METTSGLDNIEKDSIKETDFSSGENDTQNCAVLCTPMERKAKKYESLFNGMMVHSPDVIMILEADGKIRYTNQRSLVVLGYNPIQLEGTDFFKYLSEDYVNEQRAMFSSNIVSEHPSFSTSFSFIKSDKTSVYLEAYGSNYLNNSEISGIVLTLRDITKQKTAEEKAFFYENYDPLTQLPNRSLFLKKLENHMSTAMFRNKTFGIMILGIDRFKPINDMYGTRVGDELLKLSAQALKQTFWNDDIVARYRGDKFILLFPEIKSSEHINEVIAKARSAFSSSFDMGLGQQITMSISMGMAFYPNDGDSALSLIKNAESALYLAKENGQNQHRLYDSRLNEELIERQKVEVALGEAIGKRRFEPYFQAKTDRLGNIIGAEVLVRWRTLDGSLRLPDSFISIAEENGSIDRISTVLLYKTCEIISEWNKQGLKKIPISINLSPRQFGQKHLVEDIATILELTGVHPSQLEFEITESGIMKNEKDSIAQLRRIRELGSGISIDDFGTGYSSFSKLKDYPINTIKIDKSFIDPIPENSKAIIITEAIIELSHTLDFSVVAEGVETIEQYKFLDSIFCDYFQGFIFAKPVPVAEFTEMLRSNRPLEKKI